MIEYHDHSAEELDVHWPDVGVVRCRVSERLYDGDNAKMALLECGQHVFWVTGGRWVPIDLGWEAPN